MNWLEKAEEKLRTELKDGKFDRYGEVMKAEVSEALLEFCRQDEEFAQAVAQGGKFTECMAEVAKGVKGNGISDMTAFGRAVSFYFPGAKIKVEMSIDLIGDAAAPEDAEKGGVVIDLSAFF